MKTSILRAALFTPTRSGWGLSMLAWGDPGVAKSAIIEDLCASVGLPCVVLCPGEQGEGAFGVVPVPDRSGVIKYPPPEWTLLVADGGVVFIDEMVDCLPAVAPALQGLLLSGRIGGAKLGPRVRRLGAANPPEVSTSGQDVSPPNANRVGHLDWGAPTVEEHTSFMLRGSTGAGAVVEQTLDPLAEEARVLEAWPAAWARAVALETSFLGAQPQHKNVCPRGLPGANRAWPSDRSWENATRALAGAQVHGLSESDTVEFVEAFVGRAVASEWFEFIEKQDLPDAGKVLDGEVKFEHDPSRIDRTAAVLNACVSLVTPEKAARRQARVDALWNVIGKLHAADRMSNDVLVAPATALIDASLHMGKIAVPVLSRLHAIIKAADVRSGKR